MLEPDIALTDYALTLECAVCATLLARTATTRTGLRLAGMCMFVFLGLSTATGGTVHGFFPNENSLGNRLLWELTLVAVGMMAMCAWVVGAGIIAMGRRGRWLALAVVPQICLYVANVFLVTQKFWITMTIYLPAALLLIAAFGYAFWCRRRYFLLVGAAGLVLTFVAAYVQVEHIGIHPRYFNHNVLYHVVQAFALAMISLGMRLLVGSYSKSNETLQPANQEIGVPSDLP